MSKTSPTSYLLYGANEYGIKDFLKTKLMSKMGASAAAEMNITRLNGSSASLEEIRAETHAVPFLSERRMVILSEPFAAAKGKTGREKFLKLLESLPDTTACVVVIEKDLRQDHWLLTWADQHPELAWKKSFPFIKGAALTAWIQDQARQRGGEFTAQAAQTLAGLVDDNPRLADREIDKLLLYVDRERPVAPQDVQKLTADVRQGDIFAMVDAVGRGDGKEASRMLHRLLDENAPLLLYGMIIRQFRLLILVREALNTDPSRGARAIAGDLGEHPYPIKKIIPQARQFTLEQLKTIYAQLSDIDLAVKTGRLDAELALDMLTAALTQRKSPQRNHA